MRASSWVNRFSSSWAAPRARWTVPLASARDFLDSLADGKPRDRRFKTSLDIETLEKRWLPSWSATLDTAAFADPLQGTAFNEGRVTLRPADGDATLVAPLDYYQSARPDAFLPHPALVYHSASVGVKPIIQVQVASDPHDPVPTGISATLTFNGSAQSPVSFSTSGHSTGDVYLLAVQDSTAVTSSGNYSWSMSVTATFSGQSPVTVSASGSLPVDVGDGTGNKFGPGWSLNGLDSLAADGSGVLFLYGSGGARYFSGSGPTYTSPANDFGTLVKNNDNTYTYTTPQQVKEQFDTSGKMTALVDPHGVALTYSYDGSSRIAGVAAPDGGLTTLSYDGSGYLQTVQEPGAERSRSRTTPPPTT